jgi:PadR family transcriptional regulator, regulatory protein PadR
MGGGAPRSSCLGGEAYFLSGTLPIHRVASAASDLEQYPAHARTILTLPQNSTPEITALSWPPCAAIEPWRCGPNWPAIRVKIPRVKLPLDMLGESLLSSPRIPRGNDMATKPELLQGTLDMMILKALAAGSLHGYAVLRRIHQLSEEVLRIEEGSLYPALHRMERRGWIESEWAPSENNRRARYYRLTRAGRKQLERETASWATLSGAVSKVMGTV